MTNEINEETRIDAYGVFLSEIMLLTDMLLFLTALCYSTFARFFETKDEINEESRIDAYGVFLPEIISRKGRIKFFHKTLR